MLPKSKRTESSAAAGRALAELRKTFGGGRPTATNARLAKRNILQYQPRTCPLSEQSLVQIAGIIIVRPGACAEHGFASRLHFILKRWDGAG